MATINSVHADELNLNSGSSLVGADSSSGILQFKFGTAQTVKLQVEGSSTATVHSLDSTSGSSLIVRGGNGSTGSGGGITLSGGAATAGSSTLGGSVTINPGGSNRSSAGSTTTIMGGYNNHATGTGGTMTLQGGGTAGSGTAGTVIVRGGMSDGSGTAGTVQLRYGNSAGGSIGLQVDAAGNVSIGKAALSTSATDGFLYNETCAGTPSGTPTSFTGRAATILDSTNSLAYWYNSGWKAVSSVLRRETSGDADATITTGVSIHEITASLTAARTKTLPAANAVPAGHVLMIKDASGSAGTNNIIVARAGSDTIDGANSVNISANYGVLRLYSNGNNAWLTY